MKERRWSVLCFVVAFTVFILPADAQAQAAEGTNEQVIEKLKSLEERVHAVEAELATLKAQAAQSASDPTQVTATPVVPPMPAAGQLPVYGGATSAAKALNPDIGIIGNFVAATGRNSINPYPSLSLQESEASFQAIVDPYARADFFLAFGEEGVEVEEGYVTFTSLPGGLVPKIGKMRAAFGRVNTFHNHTLPWVDRPLVAFNLLGGSLREADVGIKDAGISVSKILPSPKGLFLQATGEVFRGDSGTLFKATQRSDVAVVGHLKTYADLSEVTNLEIGGSFSRGHNDLGSKFITQLYGVDATFRWKPIRVPHRFFAARTEVMWSRREDIGREQRAFGYFGSLEYQLSRRWFTGVRYDWSERGRNALQHDSGGSLVFTYWPSEFNQIRAQFRRTTYAEGQTATEALMQVLFTIGAHGAHPF
jgi:hypothetical protein